MISLLRKAGFLPDGRNRSLLHHEPIALQKSFGNAIRDISKKYLTLIDEELSIWDKIKYDFDPGAML